MPPQVRSSGWSLAYSLTYAICGFMLAAVTWLIQATGNRTMPGAALAIAVIIGFIGISLARKRLLRAGRNECRSEKPRVKTPQANS